LEEKISSCLNDNNDNGSKKAGGVYSNKNQNKIKENHKNIVPLTVPYYKYNRCFLIMLVNKHWKLSSVTWRSLHETVT
jgi:hypothetical protein